MTAFKVFQGRSGLDGSDGIDGLGVSDETDFNVSNAITDAFLPNTLSKNAFISYDRQGEASYIGRYGFYRWARKSSITNYCYWSNDLSQWQDVFNYYTYIGTTSDPDGGTNASEIELDADTSATTNGVTALSVIDAAVGDIFTLSFYIKVLSGTVSSVDVSFGTGTTIRYTLDTPTASWQRVSYHIVALGARNLFISPRGLTGARIAIYGIQLEDNLSASELITTTGISKTEDFEWSVSKESDKGWLIEEQKTNYVKNSNDMSLWTKTNAVSSQWTGVDVFNKKHQIIHLTPDEDGITTLTQSTDALTPGTDYTVSFFIYVLSGLITDISGVLGGGPSGVFTAPTDNLESVRIIKKLTASGNDDLVISISHEAGCQFLVSYVQVELNEITSPILTSSLTKTRLSDLISMPYSYNAPLPIGPWSFVFGKGYIDDNSAIKTIFSNGQSAANEFSLSYQNRILTLNNGGNTSSFDAYDYEKVVITYDGTSLKFYGETELLQSETLGSTSFIATTMYFGYNGADEFLNAYLSHCKFYNVELSLNDIKYLMGA